jgi:iron-sulfur cluster protein
MDSSDLSSRIKNALQNQRQVQATRSSTDRLKKSRMRAISLLPNAHSLRDRAEQIRRQSVQNLDRLLEEFTSNVKAKGGTVTLCRTREEANQHIIRIAQANAVKLVVKSKSMTTEELEVNDALERVGIEVIETDLGERILQLARERPAHLVAPAIHKTREEVAELFSAYAGKQISSEPEALTAEARASLRKMFLRADMGISGANIGVADSGSLILVTNEGNGRLVTALPRIHVAVMGMEKLVASLDEALVLLQLLPRSGTGQKLTCYTTIISGCNPSSLVEQRQLHVVVVDNGRSIIKSQEDLVDTLSCIRCGACSNVCPTFRVLGGHMFGHIYTGPIGIPWTVATAGLDEASRFTSLCIACGLCEDACPVKIEIPRIIMDIKQEIIREKGQKWGNRVIANIGSMSALASATAPITNRMLSSKRIRSLMEFALGLDKRRKFPRYTRSTFTKWFRGHTSKGDRRVGYFVDLYANHNEPEIGVNTVKVLELNGCEVSLPRQKHSAMPLLSYGNVDKARKIIEFNIKNLSDAVRQGRVIIASEPTAAFCLKILYPQLIDSPDAELVAKNSFELFEYLDLLRQENQLQIPRKVDGVKVRYHAPCHSKSMLPQRPVIKILEFLGYEVEEVDTGCCGMAGTYGFKKGYDGYDLSMEIGKPLFEAMGDPDYLIVTESSVCKMQIETGTGREVIHPLTLLMKAYGEAA